MEPMAQEVFRTRYAMGGYMFHECKHVIEFGAFGPNQVGKFLYSPTNKKVTQLGVMAEKGCKKEGPSENIWSRGFTMDIANYQMEGDEDCTAVFGLEIDGDADGIRKTTEKYLEAMKKSKVVMVEFAYPPTDGTKDPAEYRKVYDSDFLPKLKEWGFDELWSLRIDYGQERSKLQEFWEWKLQKDGKKPDGGIHFNIFREMHLFLKADKAEIVKKRYHVDDSIAQEWVQQTGGEITSWDTPVVVKDALQNAPDLNEEDSHDKPPLAQNSAAK
eukprot:GFYU01003722.1.p1 GENE.GFYU01003722.1~~GFYU01003722.1.p1  ORF type:complete len:314 (-),score=138.27 GFYU01003722.1:106-921(-)